MNKPGILSDAELRSTYGKDNPAADHTIGCVHIASAQRDDTYKKILDQAVEELKRMEYVLSADKDNPIGLGVLQYIKFLQSQLEEAK